MEQISKERKKNCNINERMGKEATLKYDLQWHFNPPSAPHFGGAWERPIQNVKKALRYMSSEWNNRKPSPDALRAMLVQIEALLNSRPLTHIPLGNEEDEHLTPYHFIIGRSGENVSPTTVLTTKLDRKQYKLVQHYTKLFWDQWKKEYLPTLIKRNKWTHKVEPIKENDIVVLTDDNAPPGQWLKGKVIKAHVAPDGQVRSVEVKTGTTILKRPAVKVAVVDVEQKEHNLHHNIKRTLEPSPNNKYKKKSKVINLNLQTITMLILTFFVSAIFGSEMKGLIAYDCANNDINITSYSLMDVASCVPPARNLTTTEKRIQVQ